LSNIVRLTADNPFIDVEELDRLVELHLRSGAEYSNSFAALPIGIGAEIFTFETLARSHREGHAPDHREHVNEYVLQNPGLFKITYLDNVARGKAKPTVRLTVDTKEDYDRACFIVQNARSPIVTTEEAIELCSRFA